MGPYWGHLGAVWEPFRGHLGPRNFPPNSSQTCCLRGCGPLGPSWAILGPFGVSLGPLGAILEPLGASWGHLVAGSGRLVRPLGGDFRLVGALDLAPKQDHTMTRTNSAKCARRRGESAVFEPPRSRVDGLSGPFGGHFGATLAPEISRLTLLTLAFYAAADPSCHLGPSWGLLVSAWGHFDPFWSLVEPLGAIL